MTQVRLAFAPVPKLAETLRDIADTRRFPPASFLVSFIILKPFFKARSAYVFKEWVMDSGAFSAFNSGVEIKVGDYIQTCLELQRTDPSLTEIFSLDVIGNAPATLRNTELLWKAGVRAIPTFHFGEPWEVLIELARSYPKLAIGGCVGVSQKKKFAFMEQVFARVWPKKLHGFGIAGEKMILTFPFHSVDSSNWALYPVRFALWKDYGKFRVPREAMNIRPQVEWYLELQQRAALKWRKQLDQAEAAELAVAGITS